MIAGVLVVAVAVAGVWVLVTHKKPQKAPTRTVATRTVAVERTDLSDTTTFTGSLGYAAAQTIKGAGTGTVTQLPHVGDTAERGRALFRVNDRPVPVFFGDTPLFRNLERAGTRGADVAMVEANLIKLGYYQGVLPKDPHQATLTENMLLALKLWQRAMGLEPTGKLAVGQVLVLSGPVRVASVTAKLGDPADEDLLTVTSTSKLVTLPVQAGQVSQLRTGAEAVIVLPTNATAPGKVTAIDTDAHSGSAGDSSGGGQGGGSGQTIQVTVEPENQRDVRDLDTASVQVRITTTEHKHVLAVPIAALLAVKEGGYALQLGDGTLLPVRTGMYTSRLVEVSGTGIREGMRVVTAA